MNKRILFFIFLSFTCSCVCGQKQSDSLQYDWNPKVTDSSPVRGFEISYYSNADYELSSKSELVGNGKGKINYNRVFKTKLRFPVYLNKRIRVAGSFEYSDEEIHYRNIDKNPYPLYQSLDDKNLKSIGGSLYVLTQLKRNMYFMLRLNAKLKGDYWKENIGDVDSYKFMKLEISPIVGWKINSQKSWGVGLAYSYTFGDPLIIPMIAYNHTFAPKWGVDAFLPARIKLRYRPSSLTILNLQAKVNGGSYRIHFDDPALNDFKTLELRRADVNFSFEIEKGITDWLWFSLDCGYRTNINFNVTNKNHTFSLSGSKLTKEKSIIDSYAKGGLFAQINLFVVPSKTLLKKFGIKK